MELPEIGQQCSQENCKQLDFLPLPCKCGKQFCVQHFNLHSETCQVHPKSELKKITNVHKCSRTDCNETSVVPLICEKCCQHFCVKHRHITECFEKDPKVVAEEKEKYAALVRKFNEAKNIVDQQIQSSLDGAKKRGKNKVMANKLQLMKIKNKATGLKTIPVLDRAYFNVTYGGSATPVFVAKTWTLGRVIDAVASECKLRNDNNKSTAKKLRLFKREGGEIICRDLSELLGVLLESGAVIDGDSLIIEYVSEDCEHLE